MCTWERYCPSALSSALLILRARWQGASVDPTAPAVWLRPVHPQLLLGAPPYAPAAAAQAIASVAASVQGGAGCVGTASGQANATATAQALAQVGGACCTAVVSLGIDVGL